MTSCRVIKRASALALTIGLSAVVLAGCATQSRTRTGYVEEYGTSPGYAGGYASITTASRFMPS